MIIGILGIGAAAAAPTVLIDPASTTGLAPEDTFQINISVDPDGNGVSCGQVDLLFDASVLEVTNRAKGDMLGTDALDTGSEYNNTAGTVTAVLARVGATTPPTPAGTWATITFQVKTDVTDCTTDIDITFAGLDNESFETITGITTTDGTATIGAAGPTLTVFTVEPATVAQGETVDIDIAFSEEVSWAINVNNSTVATVESWDGASTNPTVKHWDTTTETPTGDYTVDVFMNGALVGTETVTVEAVSTEPTYGVTISQPDNQTTPEGVNATYILTVTNTGNVADTYTLDVTNIDGATTAALDLTTIALDAGVSGVVALDVTNTNAGTFNVTVSATSVNATNTTDNIMTTVETSAAAAPTVLIDPASTTGLAPEDTFQINISVDPDGNGVSCGQVDLLFDASVLEVTNRAKGDMLGTDALDTGSEYNNTAGTVTAVLARVGATTPPTPAGTWATITFQVKTDVTDCTTDIDITFAGLDNESFETITGITTTDGTATIGAAGPTLTVFTVEPATVAQGETVDIDIAFSEEVSWAINVNNSTVATVESWDGASTNPTVKHWDTTTETPTGDYTVDVFMNGALVGTETVTVSSGVGAPDTTPPNTAGHDPVQDATGVPIDMSITVHVLDDGSGVNMSTIVMTVNGTVVTPDITGTTADYTIAYTPPNDFGYDQLVNVTIDAADLNETPNVMTTDAYSFTTGSVPEPTSFVILDPANGTVGTPITVTVEVRDQYDDLVDTYQYNVTLNASGSATGDGLVNIVNGTGSLDISDTVAETVTLSLNDTEETGLDVTSTWAVTFVARDNGGSGRNGGNGGTYPPGWGEEAPAPAATPAPTAAPEPTVAPTKAPTVAPTEAPTKAPTVAATEIATTEMQTTGIPGFGAVLTVFAIAGLLVAAYLVMRRRE